MPPGIPLAGRGNVSQRQVRRHGRVTTCAPWDVGQYRAFAAQFAVLERS
jgi:hypothetical protein